MRQRLHLPKGGMPPPSNEAMVKKMRAGRMKTKNPFHYLSGSIAASQKRRKHTTV